MPNSIFLSYRRADSQHAAFAIADRLGWAFGADEVFLDRGSIRAGQDWPDSLRHGLEEAKALVVVIGESWLTTADKWGRRRIDDESDWVRREIVTALEAKPADRTKIIPVLLDDAPELQAEAFDAALRRLPDFKPKRLRADSWEDGLENLIVCIAQETGLTRKFRRDERNPNGSPARPQRKQSNERTMDDAEVRTALEPLGGWQLQWGPHAWGARGLAQEITRSYEFDSFAETTAFMAEASKAIDAWNPPHHPRWENQWKVLNVSFTTWDVDCQVTRLDIAAAKKFHGLYKAWNAAASTRTI